MRRVLHIEFLVNVNLYLFFIESLSPYLCVPETLIGLKYLFFTLAVRANIRQCETIVASEAVNIKSNTRQNCPICIINLLRMW